jgi:hypothetical protein
MSCGNFHLVNTTDLGCYAIYQGLALGAANTNSGHTIFVPNTNLTGKTIIGEIRSASIDDGGLLLTSLTFSIPVYNASVVIPGYNNGVAVPASSFRMSLSAAITKTLKAPLENLPSVSSKTINKVAEAGVNVWVYDVRAIDNSDPSYGLGIIEPSFVQVIERSTL